MSGLGVFRRVLFVVGFVCVVLFLGGVLVGGVLGFFLVLAALGWVFVLVFVFLLWRFVRRLFEGEAVTVIEGEILSEDSTGGFVLGDGGSREV